MFLEISCYLILTDTEWNKWQHKHSTGMMWVQIITDLAISVQYPLMSFNWLTHCFTFTSTQCFLNSVIYFSVLLCLFVCFTLFCFFEYLLCFLTCRTDHGVRGLTTHDCFTLWPNLHVYVQSLSWWVLNLVISELNLCSLLLKLCWYLHWVMASNIWLTECFERWYETWRPCCFLSFFLTARIYCILMRGTF